MSVNKARPHVFVFPEDDANRQLANGFALEVDQRQMQVLPVSGGWIKAVDRFKSDHTSGLRKFVNRHLVLLIDFDEDPNRRSKIEAEIPSDLADRVFILGVWTEAEYAKSSTGQSSCEASGRILARDCRDQTEAFWGHQLLKHNASELTRLGERVRSILFP